MFLLRGAFWVAVVAVFSPREAQYELPDKANAAASVVIDGFRERVLATLSRVEAEFAAEDRERFGRGPPA